MVDAYRYAVCHTEIVVSSPVENPLFISIVIYEKICIAQMFVLH